MWPGHWLYGPATAAGMRPTAPIYGASWRQQGSGFTGPGGQWQNYLNGGPTLNVMQHFRPPPSSMPHSASSVAASMRMQWYGQYGGHPGGNYYWRR